MRHSSKKAAAAGLALAAWAAVGALASRSRAAAFTWINSAGGFFSTSPNWNPVGTPAAADTATFDLPATYTVTFGLDATNQFFIVRDGSVTFNLSGFTYTQSTAQDFVGVLNGTAPRLTISNGTLAFPQLVLGSGAASTGVFTVSAGATMTGGAIFVGSNGLGTFAVQSGGVVSSTNALILGQSVSGIGTAIISGTTSVATFGAGSIGAAGSGSLNISTGGTLRITGAFSVGSSVGSDGAVSVTGTDSLLRVGSLLNIGAQGVGSVSIGPGGSLVATALGTVLGVASGASGTLSVSGAGANATLQSLNIGSLGSGVFQVDSGGVVNCTSSTLVAPGAASTGSVSVSGPGSTWNAGPALTIGSAISGDALMSVSNGGTVRIDGPLFLNEPGGAPSGILTLDSGGSIFCTSFNRSGTFNFNDGTLGLTNGNYQNGGAPAPQVIDGNTASANPTLVLNGLSQWVNVSSLTIGNTRRGRLIINDVSSATVPGTVTIGGSVGSSGVVIVGGDTGAADLTASGTLGVGASAAGASGGAATLQINRGGNVNASGALIIGPSGHIEVNGGSLTIGNPSGNFITLFFGGQFKFNSGNLIFDHLTILNNTFADFFLGPAHTLSEGQTLTPTSNNTLQLAAPLIIDGGTVGYSLISGGNLTNLSMLTINRGGINLSGLVTNSSMMSLGGTGSISATNGFTNNGTVELRSSQSLITGGVFTNNGTVRGTANLFLQFNNNATGRVQVDAGQRIEFAGMSNLGQFNITAGGQAQFDNPVANSSQFSVVGGIAEFDGAVTNNAAGAFTGHDQTLRFNGGLTNNGSLLVTSGQSDIFGAITNNGGGKIIVSGAGTATFYNPITNNAGAELRVSTGATGVFFGAVNGPGTISGSGLKIFEGGMSSMGPLATQTGSSIVESSASILADNVRENALTVSGQFTVRPNGTNAATSRLNSLTIDFGRMDLNDNDLVVDYTGANPFASLYGYLAIGRLHSSVADASTTPKTALGIADNAALGLSVFSGQVVDPTSILIKYTYAGDANLDGQVDVTDLGALATHWQTPAFWTGGDFNYDGFVDVTDLGVLATNWQAGVGSPLAPSRLDEALAAVGLRNIRVPEPASIGVLSLLTLTMLERRRLRRCSLKTQM